MKINEINFTPLNTSSLGIYEFYLPYLKLFKSKKAAISVVIIILLFLIAPLTDADESNFLNFISSALIYLIVISSCLLLFWQIKVKQNKWNRFALLNNWQILDRYEYESLVHKLYPPGLGQGKFETTDLVKAQIEDAEVYIFDFSFTQSEGELDRSFSVSIFAYELPKIYPWIQLDSKTLKKGINNKFESQTISLEGDFDKFFKLRVQKGEQIDALSIIGPDAMAILIDSGKEYDIEVYANKLFFILPLHNQDSQKLRTYFENTLNIYKEIVQNNSKFAKHIRA